MQYDSVEELHTHCGAEQVYSLALAIDNIKSGKGFIIGSKTETGKGHVTAGMIKYALLNDLTSVFMTEKPTLYKNMYRDTNNMVCLLTLLILS